MLAIKKLILVVMGLVLMSIFGSLLAGDDSYTSPNNSFMSRGLNKFCNSHKCGSENHKYRLRYNHYRSYQHDHHAEHSRPKYGYKYLKPHDDSHKKLKDYNQILDSKSFPQFYRSRKNINKSYKNKAHKYRSYDFNHSHVKQHRIPQYPLQRSLYSN